MCTYGILPGYRMFDGIKGLKITHQFTRNIFNVSDPSASPSAPGADQVTTSSVDALTAGSGCASTAEVLTQHWVANWCFTDYNQCRAGIGLLQDRAGKTLWLGSTVRLSSSCAACRVPPAHFPRANLNVPLNSVATELQCLTSATAVTTASVPDFSPPSMVLFRAKNVG